MPSSLFRVLNRIGPNIQLLGCSTGDSPPFALWATDQTPLASAPLRPLTALSDNLELLRCSDSAELKGVLKASQKGCVQQQHHLSPHAQAVTGTEQTQSSAKHHFLKRNTPRELASALGSCHMSKPQRLGSSLPCCCSHFHEGQILPKSLMGFQHW